MLVYRFAIYLRKLHKNRLQRNFYSHNQELEFGFFRLISRHKFMLFIVFHLVRVQTSLQTD